MAGAPAPLVPVGPHWRAARSGVMEAPPRRPGALTRRLRGGLPGRWPPPGRVLNMH